MSVSGAFFEATTLISFFFLLLGCLGVQERDKFTIGMLLVLFLLIVKVPKMFGVCLGESKKNSGFWVFLGMFAGQNHRIQFRVSDTKSVYGVFGAQKRQKSFFVCLSGFS